MVCQVLSSIAHWKLFEADQYFEIILSGGFAKDEIIHGSID